MNTIIYELLLLSSVRKGELEIIPLNMAAIVREARGRLNYMIEEHKAEISDPRDWPVAVGYTPWVEEVWVNYISNALKYGGKPPQLELGATPQDDGMIRFWIKDNGPGLTPEQQEMLFIPFSRLNQADIEGHGLGLSIVQRIIEKLGGSVGVESSVGQGSTFYFNLPSAPQK
jgi:signal transduction histidine kinase